MKQTGSSQYADTDDINKIIFYFLTIFSLTCAIANLIVIPYSLHNPPDIAVACLPTTLFSILRRNKAHDRLKK